MSVPRPSTNEPQLKRGICGQERFFIAYGLAPTDSPLDQAKDLTTVVLLKVENEELHFVASKVLPGEGMVAVVDKESS